jgi:aryl-alcohol dehydrogenase-like predicted oxidoreductase
MGRHISSQKKNSFLNKLSIGTAAFGMDYGITNSSGAVSMREAERILIRGYEKGVRSLDTAAAYGNAEKTLGEIGVGKFLVTTKISGPDKEDSTLGHWDPSKILFQSLKDLKIERCHTALLHDPAAVDSPNATKIAAQMLRLKQEGLAQHVGFSSYEPAKAFMSCVNFGFDAVQVPFNFFDRRAASTGLLDLARKNGIRTTVRSVYLQGLLLAEPSNRGACERLPLQATRQFRACCKAQCISPEQAALSFALQQASDSEVVVGMTSVDELEKTLKASRELKTLVWNERVDWDPSYDPRTWQNKR